MYRDPVPKNSWVFLTRGRGEGQGPPCRNAYGHIIEQAGAELGQAQPLLGQS